MADLRKKASMSQVMDDINRILQNILWHNRRFMDGRLLQSARFCFLAIKT